MDKGLKILLGLNGIALAISLALMTKAGILIKEADKELKELQKEKVRKYTKDFLMNFRNEE